MKRLLSEAEIKKIPKGVFYIFDKFTKAGYEIYLVGGCVRDLFLERPIVNCDFTTNAHPEQIQEVLPDSFYNNIFGTVAIIIESEQGKEPALAKAMAGEKYEITTYRGELGYSDNRRPDQVWWGETLEEDLKRRDFTINAMAIGPTSKSSLPDSPPTSHPHPSLELIDLFEGQKDLEKKITRAVGDPNERFSEDALRMMRAIRFASQLGFTLEPETFSAIQKNSKLITKISKERIKEELFKILESDFPSEGITLLYTSGLLEYIIPELIKGYGMEQKGHHIYDVWTHSLMSLKKCPSKDPLVRFACLIHDIGKPVVVKGEGKERTFYNHEVIGASIARNIAGRLRFSKKETERLVSFIRWHQFSVDDQQTDSAIRRFIRNVSKENLEDILSVRIGDRLGGGARETSWRLEKYKQRLIEVQKQPFTVADLKNDGHDVMKIFNLKPGPEVGQILTILFKEVEEGKIKNEREILLKRLEEIKTSP